MTSGARGRPRIPFRSVNRSDLPGYDPGLQRHHLLPRALLSHRSFAAMFGSLDPEWLAFDDFRRNGLLLPCQEPAVLRMGLPLHRGPHHRYNGLVRDRVGQIEATWAVERRRCPTQAGEHAAMRLALLQRALRLRLLDGTRSVRWLNSRDPLGHRTDFTDLDAMADALWPATEATSAPPADEPSRLPAQGAKHSLAPETAEKET